MENSNPVYHMAIYGSHDSSICIRTPEGHYRIFELERLTKIRNYALNNDKNYKENLHIVKNIIANEFNIRDFGSCYYGQVDSHILAAIKEIFNFQFYEEISHHTGHAACGLYQSNFDKDTLIISSDGGGHEINQGIVTFAIFIGNKGGSINKIADLPIDVCSPYTMMAIPITEINKSDIWAKYLTYAGKIMGLAAYGKVRQEWVPAMEEFYCRIATLERLRDLGTAIGLNLSHMNTISGNDSYDLAATSQYVFEKITLNTILPFIHRHEMPIILTGGGALNVLFNQKLKQTIERPIFVPCNPNDCGLSFGFMALRNPPHNGVANVQYNGFGILDLQLLDEQIKKYDAKQIDSRELARIICKGSIVGVMRGDSECGPRALGNRSILCLPSISGMKDKLNKIKHREFYRPFAPIVRTQDAKKYFSDVVESKTISSLGESKGVPFAGESPYMSYAPIVNEQYRANAIGIVHADGSARLQTVSRSENAFIYDVLDAVDIISGDGILINTSFNIRGEPILTRVADAISVLEDTEIDYVLIGDYLFKKK